MRDLDDTDRQILRLLVADARRPYSDIAEHVDLSAPAVSDRIDRLRELGVVRGFTVDVDQSLLTSGVPVLVELGVPVTRTSEVAAALRDLEAVEHTFETADGAVVVQATVRDGDVTGLLDEAVDLERLRDVEVRLLRKAEWTPSLGEATLSLTCAECSNTVTSEGESTRLEGELYHFCCGSCLTNFEERFERLQSGA
ncbi:DNA-binding transcriptional regulator, Lrp family [Halogranum amylolyticum]|uniref:DNA-binding transcriptional regulator, Lrp family n=1 Tax=Halogranum amylolyticum TaxID=660520 RepID=A0A1H8U4W3_9EURY|nr:AsnC family transcriptional regulator [Halogranum amylolyticum]SEO98279.1 DNA-binding transcriptional regulator, Lrp family [Halogranum amylolyticum]